MKNQFKCKVTEDRSVGDIPQRHEVGIFALMAFSGLIFLI